MEKIVIEYTRNDVETTYGKLSDERWLSVKNAIEQAGEELVDNELAWVFDQLSEDE